MDSKQAARDRAKAWRTKNREAHRAYQREYRQKHPDHNREWFAAHPERVRGYRLRNAYGITPENFDLMVEAQGGGCAICGKSDDLVADHDHETGRWRSVLCRGCNVSLGYLERGLKSRILRDPDQLAKAQAITRK